MPEDSPTAKFRSVFDMVTLGLVVVDQNGIIRSWNLWMQKYSRIDAGAAVGRHLLQIFPELARGRVDSSLKFALQNELTSVLSHSLNKSPFPLFLPHDDTGTPARISQSIQLMPISTPDQLTHCLIQITDVSLAVSREKILREQQQELQIAAVALNSSDGIMITDKDANIIRVNQAFQDITGYLEQDIIGKNPKFMSSGRHDRHFYDGMWDAILSTGSWSGELWDKHRNGSVFPKQSTITAVKNIRGETTQYVAIFREISERKRIEQELEKHQSNLEELVRQRTAELSTALEAAQLADHTKDAFLANMSHELRTPLNAVIGMAGLAKSLSTTPLQREYLEKIAISSTHLHRIINDLLDLSKIAAGHMEMENIAFDLRDLLKRCTSVTADTARNKGLELIATIDTEVHDVLLGDPLRIEQILINLIGNAIKFTKTGRVEVRISQHASDENHVYLTIEVRDTGIGIRTEDIERLFKPFSQADSSISRQFGGTGLGLAISRRLVEMMDGEISVVSREGSGSTFTARIRLELGDAADLAPTVDATPELLRVSYRDTRVLVVDDQPFNRDVVQGLLTMVGITLIQAENGQAALDILTGHADVFDLVLMDIQMPVMDGLTATRAIRRLDGFAALPIIAMTAHTMTHERDKSIEAGMNDHIGKPFSEAGFYGMLAKWITRSKQHQTIAAAPPAHESTLPHLCGIDTVAGLALMVGDETRYRHWLVNFTTEAPAVPTQIRLALATGMQEAASMLAHALKGRTGLLGMNELQTIAAALEASIDSAQPANELLLDLEREIAIICAEIRKKLHLPDSAAPVTESVQGKRPAGSAPPSVRQLIARLQAGDSDCDTLVTNCLDELKNTDWAPPLQQALIHIRNFDFAAAGRQLFDEQDEPG